MQEQRGELSHNGKPQGYAGGVTFETAVPELFERFPDLRSKQNPPGANANPDPHEVFRSQLIPKLEAALEEHNLRGILTVCAYLEDAAESAEDDPRLADLLRTTVGQWHPHPAYEPSLSPWLGAQTRRICGSLSGARQPPMATKRDESSLTARMKSAVQRWFGRSADRDAR